LYLMNRMQFLDRLQFDNDGIADNHVDAKPGIDLGVPVNDGKGDLSSMWNIVRGKLGR